MDYRTHLLALAGEQQQLDLLHRGFQRWAGQRTASRGRGLIVVGRRRGRVRQFVSASEARGVWGGEGRTAL